MHLVIGGPKHGELVDWPIRHHHYAVPVNEYNPLTETTIQTRYYRVARFEMFDRPIEFWLYERLNLFKPEEWIDLFLKEILSYKGGHLFRLER
jgi:hypothetical protein